MEVMLLSLVLLLCAPKIECTDDNGASIVEFQSIPTSGASAWHSFSGNKSFLLHEDNVRKNES